MKQSLLILLMAILISTSLSAQEPSNQEKQTREEKIQSLEIAFISRKLNLNPEEAQKFWPIYNEYKRDIRQIAINQRAKKDHDVLELEEKIIDVRKRYKEQFTAAVGKDRMNTFFKAEHEFRGVLLNRIKNHPERPGLNREKRLRN
jgi:hypothetical protein